MGLFALIIVLCVDAWTDGDLDGSPWSYLLGIGVLVYGPPLLLALPDVLRAWFGRKE